MKELLFQKEMKVPEVLKQVQRHPSYDMQGKCENIFLHIILVYTCMNAVGLPACVCVCVCVYVCVGGGGGGGGGLCVSLSVSTIFRITS